MKILRLSAMAVAAASFLVVLVGSAVAAKSGNQQFLPPLAVFGCVSVATFLAIWLPPFSLASGLLNCMLVGIGVSTLLVPSGELHPKLLRWTGIVMVLAAGFNALALFALDPNLPLVLKQMRQRALGTWLTLLSVTLGVSLAITILILFREAGHLFGQTEFGYEIIVGKPGSATQLVMNTVYHVDASPGNIPYSVYEEMLDPDRHNPNPGPKIRSILGTGFSKAGSPTGPAASGGAAALSQSVAAAVPVFVGDTLGGQYRMIGTTTNMFGVDDTTHQPLDRDHQLPYEGRNGDAKFYEFAEGQVFAPDKFEAVIGSDVAAKKGLKIGSAFQATHGELPPSGTPDVYPETWKVVGILKPTGTPNDACVFVPLLSMYAAGDHAPSLTMKWAAKHDDRMPPPTTGPDQVKPYRINSDGTFSLYLPKVCWQVSAILVKGRGAPATLAATLISRDKVTAVDPMSVNNRPDAFKPGCDLVVGDNGPPADIVIDTLDHSGTNSTLIPYSVYESLLPAAGASGSNTAAPPTTAPAATEPTGETPFDYSPQVKAAVPYVVGDTYQGTYRIIGTTTNLFGIDDETHKPLDPDHTIPYRPEDIDESAKYYEFAQGHCFAPNRFEAVIGSDVAEKSDLKMGSTFQATHGEAMPVGTPDIHPEKWVVVGVLKRTHTANDACVFIPILSAYTVEDHALGLKSQWILQHQGEAPPADADPDEVHAYKMNPDGTFTLYVPREYWEVSAILVKTRVFPQQFMYSMNNRHETAMAVSPAQTMQDFFNRFLKPSQILLLVIALMVSIVAAIGILVSIYNSVAARSREIAIIRALGATRNRVLLLICTEAGLIGLIGSVTGLVTAHLVAAIASQFFEKYLGEGIGWYRVAATDWYYVAGITVLATLAGFVPAIKAYSTPVATNLVAS